MGFTSLKKTGRKFNSMAEKDKKTTGKSPIKKVKAKDTVKKKKAQNKPKTDMAKKSHSKKPDETAQNKTGEKSAKKPSEKPAGKTDGKPVKKPDALDEKKSSKTGGKPSTKPVSKTEGKPSEKSAKKPDTSTEKSSTKTEEKPAEEEVKQKKKKEKKPKPVAKVKYHKKRELSADELNLIKGKPKFNRQEHRKLPRIGQKWRAPRGIDSKKIEGKRGKGKSPDIGYKKPVRVSGLQMGYKPVLVMNVSGLGEINTDIEAAVIAKSVGRKKRNIIITEANDKKIVILNPRKGEL